MRPLRPEDACPDSAFYTGRGVRPRLLGKDPEAHRAFS